MEKRKLNQLVVEYQNGNSEVVDDIFKAINPMIEKASRDIEKFVDDFTKFDCRMVTKAKQLIETFDDSRDDFLAIFKTRLTREKAQFIKRNSRKHERQTSMATLEGDGEEDLGYQFKSSADVEAEIEFKERVTLLAQGNPKKETILSQWSKGATDTSISELLAQLYGGNAKSHRVFVARFKTECRTRLATDF